MTNFIGQQTLVQRLMSYNLDTLPKTIMLIGEVGCGKHTLAKKLAQNLSVELIEITKDTTSEELSQYQIEPIDKLYLIDINLIIEKQQNKLLKFIEEPSAFSHIILIANSEVGILETVTNRCIKYYFNKYTTEELKNFEHTVNNPCEEIYKVYTTPGQLINSDGNIVKNAFELCEKIITRLNTSSFANALSISTKINYKEDYNKIDLNLFLKTLKIVASEDYIKNKNINSFKIYKTTINHESQMVNKSLLTENFTISLLIDLWREVHTNEAQRV